MCEAQKCQEFSRPLQTFNAHNHYCCSLHLLRLHNEQLNTHQFCDCSCLVVRLFILITYAWWKSFGTCVYQQFASDLAQYRNGSHIAGISTPIWPQQCHLSFCKCVTLLLVSGSKNGSIRHSSQTTLWFSILASAIVECKYYTNVLGQLTANMNIDVPSKTACNQLAQNTPNTMCRLKLPVTN